MASPLHPTFRKRISDAINEIIRKQVTPWAFLNSGTPLKVQRFNGQQISYGGIGFEGSPQTVFWAGYIEPFLEDLTINEIREAVKQSQERHVDGEAVLLEVKQFLIAGIQKVYSQMIDVDRRLRGKGFPDKVTVRSAEKEMGAMRHFIEERVQAEIIMVKNAQKSSTIKNVDDGVNRSIRLQTITDFERNIDRLLRDKINYALKIHNDLKSAAAKAGGFSNSRYPITDEAQLFTVLQDSIAESMKLMSHFFLHVPYETLRGVARNRLDNHVQNLINVLDESNRPTRFLNLAEVLHKYSKEVEDAFKDFEIGFIQGQPFRNEPQPQSAENASVSTAKISEIWDKERTDALRRLDDIEKSLKELAVVLRDESVSSPMRGIGDNNPPEPIEQILTQEEIEESLNTINVYRAELNSTTPRVDVIRQCGKLFKLLGKAVVATTYWIGGKLDKFAGGAATAAGAYLAPKILDQLNVNVAEIVNQIPHIIEIIEKSL